MKFPEGSIPGCFTIIARARYSGEAQRRIFDAAEPSWFLGFWKDHVGVAHYDSWETPHGEDFKADEKWHLMVGRNSPFLPTFWFDGEERSDQTGGIGLKQLTINDGYGKITESSDCEVSDIIIFARHLSNDEVNEAMAKFPRFHHKAKAVVATADAPAPVAIEVAGDF